MTDQTHKIQTILARRISLVQEIASANCEQMRLNQIASGMMILDQKDDVEGTDIGARSSERVTHDDSQERCMKRIASLESELAALDQELAITTERENQ